MKQSAVETRIGLGSCGIAVGQASACQMEPA
jgi:hypothetical protein